MATDKKRTKEKTTEKTRLLARNTSAVSGPSRYTDHERTGTTKKEATTPPFMVPLFSAAKEPTLTYGFHFNDRMFLTLTDVFKLERQLAQRKTTKTITTS
jgi:hypothetical protein